MKHSSRLFGPFEYKEDQVITFREGLLGFPQYTRYVLKKHAGTEPVRWLLSVEEGGPEVALIEPGFVDRRYAYTNLKLTSRTTKALEMTRDSAFTIYAAVTMPENVKQMSMNLRTPIVICPASKRGVQYSSPELEKKPVRALIYRDLIFSRPEDKSTLLVIKRKPNETIEIGDEISLQVMDIADGGVHIGINAPKFVKVSRGESLVTPKCETIRANQSMNVKRLEGIMSMHQVMQDPEKYMDSVPAPVAPTEKVS